VGAALLALPPCPDPQHRARARLRGRHRRGCRRSARMLSGAGRPRRCRAASEHQGRAARQPGRPRHAERPACYGVACPGGHVLVTAGRPRRLWRTGPGDRPATIDGCGLAGRAVVTAGRVWLSPAGLASILGAVIQLRRAGVLLALTGANGSSSLSGPQSGRDTRPGGFAGPGQGTSRSRAPAAPGRVRVQ
jgi:hypothetical protein